MLGFRPLQIYTISLEVALLQLVMLPAAALLLNLERVDSRWVMFTGLACVGSAAFGNSFLTIDWQTGQFYLWQVLNAVGVAFV